ncbi:MAG: DUF2555 domain-containing protein [Cyanobacteriota bacterium]|nr:DUF2555 domain-containing protein [Cyanobacteriota bacterium]
MSSQTHASAQPLTFTAEQVAEIAERLEKDTYASLFGCLEDWHALKSAAFHAPNLVAPYIHLLELEIDED